MTIYVDDLRTCSPTVYHGHNAGHAARVGKYYDHQWCHLFADEADCLELHQFAARLGCKRAWFQGSHYDLVPSKRTLAILLGAQPVDRHRAVEIRRAQRQAEAGKGG